MRAGDRLVVINGVNVIEATLETARRLIDRSGDTVHMVIEYDIAVMGMSFLLTARNLHSDLLAINSR